MNKKIRIVIVDDMPKILDYFSMILSNESDMEVVGKASSGAQAIQVVKDMRPDILLTDINMEK